MRKQKSILTKFFALCLLSTAILLTGCGGGGGGNSGNPPIYPSQDDPSLDDPSTYPSGENSPIIPSEDKPGTTQKDIPTESVTADAFNKGVNEIYTFSANADNIAVNLPSNETYFLQVTNQTSNQQRIRLIEEGIKASARASEDFEDVALLAYSDVNQMLADEAHMEVRKKMRMALALRHRVAHKAVNASRMAKSAPADHSYEKEGEYYSIWTSDLNYNPCLLNKCKLVKVTEHAKFFVDQNYSFGYDPQAEKMEKWVLDPEFGLAKVFDEDKVNMYDTLTNYFGKMHDVDNDGKVSIVITPFLSHLNSSLQGLFTDGTMNPDFNDENDGPRDMVLLAPPSYFKGDNQGKNELLTNLIHESQHLVNYSQRAFDDKGEYIFNNTAFAQELGFDEGCSICAETIFRQLRGQNGYQTLYNYKGGAGIEYAGNSSRFANYLNSLNVNNVFPFDVSNFDYGYEYGRNGLFVFYLYDRFGKENFKKLIQQGWQGNKLREVIPQLLGTKETLDELQQDWHFALQSEYIKTEQNKADLPGVDGRFKYSDWLRLDASPNRTVTSGAATLNAHNSIMYKIRSGSASDKNYRFYVQSSGDVKSKNLTLNIIKLPK